ncbi:MAG: phosphatidylglycerol lysyltransferase domain-containing protein [Victivallaceae bacterium]|nr:phosphatidylglycerol lysyltransferase domain-containing protein [Victivallaceae bacterium]
MMDFRKFTLSDAGAVRNILAETGYRLCEYSAGNMFLWRNCDRKEFCIDDGVLYQRCVEGECCFYMLPAGGDFNKSMAKLSESAGTDFALCCVPRDMLPVLERIGVRGETDEAPEWRDYLYNASDLIDLPGGRYSAKRNHIRQFERQCPDAEVLDLSMVPAADITKFLEHYYSGRPEPAGEIEREEMIQTMALAVGAGDAGLDGLVVRVGGRIAALTIGELCGRTLQVHVEKGDVEFHGVYPFVMRTFAARYRGRIDFINRQEDDGVEGLRKSKLSYHPCAWLEKLSFDFHAKTGRNAQ